MISGASALLTAAWLVSALWIHVFLRRPGHRNPEPTRFEFEQELLFALDPQNVSSTNSPSAEIAEIQLISKIRQITHSFAGALESLDDTPLNTSRAAINFRNATQPILAVLKQQRKEPKETGAPVQFFVGSASCSRICALAFAEVGIGDCVESWFPLLLEDSVARAAFPRGCDEGFALATSLTSDARASCEAGTGRRGELRLCPCAPRPRAGRGSASLLQRTMGRLVVEEDEKARTRLLDSRRDGTADGERDAESVAALRGAFEVGRGATAERVPAPAAQPARHCGLPP